MVRGGGVCALRFGCAHALPPLAGLGEHAIRDLNDEINKLMREKRHWQRRIVELGGTNYAVRDAAICRPTVGSSANTSRAEGADAIA